jgi:hypothetical protein
MITSLSGPKHRARGTISATVGGSGETSKFMTRHVSMHDAAALEANGAARNARAKNLSPRMKRKYQVGGAPPLHRPLQVRSFMPVFPDAPQRRAPYFTSRFYLLFCSIFRICRTLFMLMLIEHTQQSNPGMLNGPSKDSEGVGCEGPR